MKTTFLRIAKNGSIVAVGLLIFGMMFAQIAQMWLMSNTPPRMGPVMTASVTQTENVEVANGIRWRLPLSMAAWGFALIAGFETLAGVWRGNQKETLAVKPSESHVQTIDLLKTNEAEELVQKQLRELEKRPANLTDTPAPVGTLRMNVPLEAVH